MRFLVFVGMLLIVIPAFAQRRGPNPPLVSLKTVPPPSPIGADRYVLDQTALVVLGKALFWDMQAGSDGRTACATCHFHAGADHRVQHQLSGPDANMNQVLASTDFPFRKLANPDNNRSAVVSFTQQVAGSMGVVAKEFVEVEAGSDTDVSSEVAFPSQFMPNGVHLRQVTARNSPSVINAVYNVRNFWDGRASAVFTGATPFGDSDKGLHVLAYREGRLEREPVQIENASLASQAVGPALNSVEMSWAGRKWPQLGRKLLSLTPLARQRVSPTDSVLGAMANPDGNGLSQHWSYLRLIQTAFRPEYYSSAELTDGFTQAEHNIALFWGLAIQAYESTLISDDTRVDQFLEGRSGALTALEQQGLNEFRSGGSQCTNCHNGAEFTAAGWSVVQRRGGNITTPADLGFFRIGVRPIDVDIGFGTNDDFGLPLFPQAIAGAAGTFKTPGLRNVEFTGPYFHNGGQATLEQVLQFYDRNGDFPDGGNLGPGIGRINLNQADRIEILAFLKALSDDRVRFQRAPFDHPSICVPNGHVTLPSGEFELDPLQGGSIAFDKWVLVPEIGREGTDVPLQTFEELLEGLGNDGSRANTMTTPCRP
jgi:cytochrome c peroxidase